jgi:hypothetical protein
MAGRQQPRDRAEKVQRPAGLARGIRSRAVRTGAPPRAVAEGAAPAGSAREVARRARVLADDPVTPGLTARLATMLVTEAAEHLAQPVGVRLVAPEEAGVRHRFRAARAGLQAIHNRRIRAAHTVRCAAGVTVGCRAHLPGNALRSASIRQRAQHRLRGEGTHAVNLLRARIANVVERRRVVFASRTAMGRRGVEALHGQRHFVLLFYWPPPCRNGRALGTSCV